MVLNRHDRSLAVVGGFVIVSVVAFLLLFVAATNRSFAQRRAELWIELPTAEGLRKGDALLLRGVQVGEVKRIEFAMDGSGAVFVKAMLTRPVPLTTAASARLVAADVFGRQSVVLGDGDGGRALVSGDTLRGTPPVSLTGRIEGMASRIERMVSDTTIDGVHTLLAEAAAAVAALESAVRTTQAAIGAQQRPLEDALVQGAGLAANLRAATDSTALVALRTTAHGTLAGLDRVAARLDTASTALLHVMARVDAGQGSLGMIASDPALYQRAVASLESFESLITDIRRNPKRYINISVF
jgi:phospholipid/cholesterol/gamma-HCH transport system substrate-binding protein